MNTLSVPSSSHTLRRLSLQHTPSPPSTTSMISPAHDTNNHHLSSNNHSSDLVRRGKVQKATSSHNTSNHSPTTTSYLLNTSGGSLKSNQGSPSSSNHQPSFSVLNTSGGTLNEMTTTGPRKSPEHHHHHHQQQQHSQPYYTEFTYDKYGQRKPSMHKLPVEEIVPPPTTDPAEPYLKYIEKLRQEIKKKNDQIDEMKKRLTNHEDSFMLNYDIQQKMIRSHVSPQQQSESSSMSMFQFGEGSAAAAGGEDMGADLSDEHGRWVNSDDEDSDAVTVDEVDMLPLSVIFSKKMEIKKLKKELSKERSERKQLEDGMTNLQSQLVQFKCKSEEDLARLIEEFHELILDNSMDTESKSLYLKKIGDYYLKAFVKPISKLLMEYPERR